MRRLFIFLLPLSLVSALLPLSCKNKDDAPEKTQTDNNAAGSGESEAESPVVMNYQVVRTYPHDTTAYTEGFLVHDGVLYESTGHTADISYTRSLFGVVDSATGRIHVRSELDKDKYFGEGIVFLGGKVYQLTYTTKVGFIYDAGTFQ